MSHFIFESDYKNKSGSVRVRLLLFHFEDENKVQFIYSPHLDLTGYANTLEEAKQSFEIAFEDFIDYTLKKKTLAKVLSDLGWKLKGSEKRPKKLLAPSIKSVIKDNNYVSEILDKYPVNTYHQEIKMPACI